MSKNWIKNFQELATSSLRQKALTIINRGLDAISTGSVLKNSASLNDNRLKIKDEELDLNKFSRIIFIGIGKAAGKAALFFDRLLVKPVITATQMTFSMTKSPAPARAEVTDVAFAIISGSDAVINGQYPMETVAAMEKIVLEAEKHLKNAYINPL